MILIFNRAGAFYRRFVLAALGVALTSALDATGFAAAAAETCRTEDLNIVRSSQAIVTHWRVAKGEVCAVSFGSGYGGNVDEFAIARNPSHGAAGVANRIEYHSFGYRSARGYVGPDHFQVRLRANNAYENYSVPVTIDVEVEVVDKL